MKLVGLGLFCLAMAAIAMPGAVAETPAGPSAHGNAPSPYAGLERRHIASLSDQQIDDLANGRGMGLALPAELNGYPGPRHALDLADELRLSDDQRTAVAALFEAMRAEAVAIGGTIITDEAELSRLFAEGEIDADKLDALTARIGKAQGRLRAVHLQAHLAMMDLLSPEQVAQYNVARGYTRHGVH